MVIGTLAGTYLFPVLMNPRPLYATAAVLLACNIAYASRPRAAAGKRNPVTLATVQMEVDLLVLTAGCTSPAA